MNHLKRRITGSYPHLQKVFEDDFDAFLGKVGLELLLLLHDEGRPRRKVQICKIA